MALQEVRKSRLLFPILLIMLLLVQSGSALAQEPPPPDGKFPGARVDTSDETGKVTFIGAEAGQPLELGKATAAGLSQGARADTVVEYVAPFFGVDDPKDLMQKQQHTQEGRVVTRYQQQYKGVPVLAGELVLNQTGDGRLMAASGEASPDLDLSVEAKISKDEARREALTVTARSHEVEVDTLKAGEPELWIYDPRLLQVSEDLPELVWRLEVSSQGLDPINELVLVNAEHGWVSLHFNQINTAWSGEIDRPTTAVTTPQLGAEPRPAGFPSSQRKTYTANDSYILPGSQLCDNTLDTCIGETNPDAEEAHRYALWTYYFYITEHGRTSLNDGGMVIVSSVDYTPSPGYDYCDSFWKGDQDTGETVPGQVVYGNGCHITADDIVGHELTHGVTEFTSGLYNWNQSGAISESFSDLWGEFIDLKYHGSWDNDDPSVRWYIGEDVEGGATRYMANPPEFNQPDSMTSKLYYAGVDDNGGVHTNSGVNNKAVYLMTDGGAFNKINVSGIGYAKVADIYYEAQTNYLTSGANYHDLYNAVYQSCLGLVGTSGIDLDDCTQVHKALMAVKMNEPPKPTAKAQAEICPAGQQPNDLFYEDFESGATSWSTAHQDNSIDWKLNNNFNVKQGNFAAWGSDYWDYGISWMFLTSGVTIPADQQVYVHFQHEYIFENYSKLYPDGGQLTYSLDGGSTWNDAAFMVDKGAKYNGKISVMGQNNPREGQNAFVGNSGGWVSTRLNLNKDSNIAGKDLMFSFGTATDAWNSSEGWYVDEFRIYTCTAGPPAMPTSLKPADSATVVGAPAHSWKGDKKVDAAYQLQYADADYNTVYISPEFTGTKFTPTYNLVGDYYWRVRAMSSSDEWSDWTPFQKITVLRAAPDAPILVSPANRSATNDTTPTLDWDPVSYDENGYEVYWSQDQNFIGLGGASTISGLTEITMGGPFTDGVWYWKVRAQNQDGIWSKWSKVSSFTADNIPPAPPIPNKPKDHSYSSKQKVTFTWKYVDKDSRNARLWIGDCVGAPGSQIIPGTKLLVPGSVAYGRYCWYLDAQDWAGNWSTTSSPTFTFDITLLKSPLDGGVATVDKPTFTWLAHPDAKTASDPQYEIMVDNDPNFGSPQAESGVVGNVTKYAWPIKLSTDIWYWTIRFSPDGGATWSDWMPAWSLDVPF